MSELSDVLFKLDRIDQKLDELLAKRQCQAKECLKEAVGAKDDCWFCDHHMTKYRILQAYHESFDRLKSRIDAGIEGQIRWTLEDQELSRSILEASGRLEEELGF